MKREVKREKMKREEEREKERELLSQEQSAYDYTHHCTVWRG